MGKRMERTMALPLFVGSSFGFTRQVHMPKKSSKNNDYLHRGSGFWCSYVYGVPQQGFNMTLLIT